MDKMLEQVDFEKYTAYDIQIKVNDTYMYPNPKEGAAQEDENGQAVDAVSNVRRTIKYSIPFEGKKIIKNINVEEERVDADENEELCRNISFNYYLLIDNADIDEFSTEVLHDDLEEEWRDGTAVCDIEIKPVNQ